MLIGKSPGGLEKLRRGIQEGSVVLRIMLLQVLIERDGVSVLEE